eukprot:g2075.t1
MDDAILKNFIPFTLFLFLLLRIFPISILCRQCIDFLFIGLSSDINHFTDKSVLLRKGFAYETRCWPDQLDFWFHMNNCVYNRWCELGRFHFLLRSGVQKKMKEMKIKAGLSGVAIRFRREIKAFQKFKVVTTLAGWDERSFYLEHQFIINKFIHAHGFSTYKFVKNEGKRGNTPSRVLEEIGFDNISETEVDKCGGINCWLKFEKWSSATCLNKKF